jgi:hypothetical protein
MQTQGGKAGIPNRPSQSANGSAAAARAALQSQSQNRQPQRPAAVRSPEPSLLDPKPMGYGLPCARCRTYYPAHLPACPVCRSSERISAPTGSAPTEPEPGALPDHGGLDTERERFLREFKAKLYAAHVEMSPSAQVSCLLVDHDEGTREPATVCKTCYDRVQERLDLAEAALHIDLKEATQIIYEAVWADPTDSTKTYRNAAQALLNEIRRRAGIATILGRLQPLPH